MLKFALSLLYNLEEAWINSEWIFHARQESNKGGGSEVWEIKIMSVAKKSLAVKYKAFRLSLGGLKCCTARTDILLCGNASQTAKRRWYCRKNVLRVALWDVTPSLTVGVIKETGTCFNPTHVGGYSRTDTKCITKRRPADVTLTVNDEARVPSIEDDRPTGRPDDPRRRRSRPRPRGSLTLS